MDVGVRAKQEARAELLSRATQDAYMDVGGRAKQEARAEQLPGARRTRSNVLICAYLFVLVYI